jgi:cytoskeleton protein RodZ
LAQIEPVELARYRDHDGAYGGVGAELREARLRVGHELQQVAEVLRIRRCHLEALEEGRFDELPGRVYAIGFLRAYAEFVGLDPAVIADRFRNQTADVTVSTELHFPEPPAQSWRPNLGLFGLALLLSIAAYGVWYYLETKGDLLRELVAEVPDALVRGAKETAGAAVEVAMTVEPAATGPAAEEEEAAIAEIASASPEEVAPDPSAAVTDPAQPETGVEAGAVAVAAEPVEEPVASAPQAPAEEAEGAEESALAEAEPEVTPASESVGAGRGEEAAPGAAVTITGALAAAPAAPTLLEDPPPPPVAPAGEYVPRVYGQGNTDSRVLLRAIADSWVQVQGADNDLIFSRILHSGDTYLAPNRDDLRLTTGNAGGLEVLVDGELMPALGSPGAVRRNIPLSADALTSGGADSTR